MRTRKSAKNSRKSRRKRKKRKNIIVLLIFFLVGAGLSYGYYFKISKPYTVGIDPGHGGTDPGAEGIIREVDLTEETAKALENILKEDGRFRVVLSRKYGEGKGINDRNHKLKKANCDMILSIHANADDLQAGTGFECYPSPPGRENYGESFAFAGMISQAMEEAGSPVRGIGGIRYGYYIPNETGEYIKAIREADDLTEYEYATFGILEGLSCPAVLVEQCFVTNVTDVAAFAGEEGAKKAATAYYNSICRYLGIASEE